jgi:hypothetical protein
LKKGATQKKGAPKGQKTAKGKASSAAPKTEGKAGKKAKPARAKDACAPRAESKDGKILELNRTSQRLDPGRKRHSRMKPEHHRSVATPAYFARAKALA